MKHARLGLFFKDFAVWCHSTSCVGLNVAGFTTAEVLRQHGVDAHAYAVRHNVDLVNEINRHAEAGHPFTHIAISAPWLSLFDVRSLIESFPEIQFVILSHSNVGFLQADPGGVCLLRAYQELAKTHDNLSVGGNSKKFCEWFRVAYGNPVTCLPNLYPFKNHKHHSHSETLKIGAFGAVRPEKNFMTAVAAAIVIQRMLDMPVEVHMSEGGEGDQGRIAPAVKQMCKDIEGITLVRHPWMYWNNFAKLVSKMDLLIQVSYTESFNMVTADGVSEGVPTVVSSAITWAPESWKADSDDALKVAEVGLKLLNNPEEIEKGRHALREHNEKSLHHWFHFLGINKSSSFRDWLKKTFGTKG